MMSPGNSGARVTSPPLSARNVFWKKDSPPSRDRPSDFMMPPVALVSIWTPPLIDTIAPLSARIDSPGLSVTRHNA